jgi:hypothetical protein
VYQAVGGGTPTYQLTIGKAYEVFSIAMPSRPRQPEERASFAVIDDGGFVSSVPIGLVAGGPDHAFDVPPGWVLEIDSHGCTLSEPELSARAYGSGQFWEDYYASDDAQAYRADGALDEVLRTRYPESYQRYFRSG